MPENNNSMAVLIPCYNEKITIESVIRDFHEKLPSAEIYVYDNNSTDKTAERALATNLCVVRHAPVQGKGAVVRQMLDEIASDYYILVDGDATYSADRIRNMLYIMRMNRLDMIVGDRSGSSQAEKFTHVFGNRLVDWLIRTKFKNRHVRDTMSGLRIFNKKAARLFRHNLKYDGFEIETEMTLLAAANKLRLGSLPISYGLRPEGSVSKLNALKDGFKIIMLILRTKKQ